MGQWTPQNLGEPLSEIVQADDAQDLAILSNQSGGSQPAFFPEGGLWYNPSDSRMRISGPGGSPSVIFRTDQGQLVDAGGSVTMAGSLKMGTNIIVNLGEGTADAHAIRRDQAVLRNGGNVWGGDQDAGGKRIQNLGAAVADGDAVRRDQVPSLVAAFAGRHYFNTNRDVVGNGQPVQLQQIGDKPGSSTIVGGPTNPFTPRLVIVRLRGTFTDQTDNGQNGPENITKEYGARRWDEDATGGDGGTSGTVVLETIDGGFANDVQVELEWRYAPADKLGFWLRCFRTDNGELQNLRNPNDLNVDGTIQVQAFYGVGSG